MLTRRTLLMLAALTLSATAQASSAQSSSTAPLVLTRNPYYPATPVSPYDARVSPYSRYGANNPYSTGGGKIYGSDGTYLGKLNANKYDAESVSNPYGKYGSAYSPASINNPYSAYGSPYSAQSATNPYAATPPKVYYTDPYGTAPAAKKKPKSYYP